MGAIFDAMQAWFEADDWHTEAIPDQPILRMGFQSPEGQWVCYAQAREPQEQFVFYSVAPVKVPAPQRQAMAEFLTRANYGMIIGNFEMDFDDGEVRYKTSLDVEDVGLLPELQRTTVYANVLMMDRYFKGIMAVAFAGSSPTEALARVEGPPEPDDETVN